MKIHRKFWLLSLAAAALLSIGGCLIVSGTFTVTKTISFTTPVNGFYSTHVDLTDNDVWADHKDDIDRIKLAGFELWLTTLSASADTFSVYIDDGDAAEITDPAALDSNATEILTNLPVAAGSDVHTYISYDDSFKYLTNFETVKTLTKTGTFYLYGVNASNAAGRYRIDSIRVILTIEASQ